MQERAVIFDFDGLLVDTETAEFLSWRRLFAEHGGALEPETWKHAVGYDGAVNPRELLESRIGKKLDWSVLTPLRRSYLLELVESLPPLPGALPLLTMCLEAGCKIGAASNSSLAWVQSGLERLGMLPYFNALATRDQVTNAKPWPDVYVLALEKMGVKSENAVAFEDSEPGVKAAKAAGIFVVAVPNEFTKLQDLSAANLVLPSLEAIDLGRFWK